jgi:hypothetical protein
MSLETLLDSYSKISKLNAQAILLMQQSKHGEALNILYVALQTLLAIGKISDGDSSSHANPVPWAGEFDGRERCEKILHSVSLLEQRVTPLDDEVFIIFNRALLLSPEVAHVARKSTIFGYLLPGVLLYNAGLAHHLQGLHNGDSWELSRALYLYFVAYNTFTDHSTKESPFLLDLGFLALANNIGHIHMNFRSFTKAEVCSEELLRRLSQLLSTAGDVPSICNEEFKPFFLNVCFSPKTQRLSAPAA